MMDNLNGNKYEIRSGKSKSKAFPVNSKAPIRHTKESPDIKLKTKMSPRLTNSANEVKDRLKAEMKG